MRTTFLSSPRACKDLRITAIAETLEPRRLLSGYTLGTLAKLSGAPSQGEIVQDNKGDLFFFSADNTGTSAQQELIELRKGSSKPTVVALFPDEIGAGVNGLAIDSTGDLFGTDPNGGKLGEGTVWEITSGSSTIITLASFNTEITGGLPNQANLFIDGNGDLFGTAQNGGANNTGTVWELRHDGSIIDELASLPPNTDLSGFSYVGGVVADGHGNLYGTIGADLSSDDAFGSVWELPAGGDGVQVLASFDGKNGSNPLSPLVVDSSGDIFGETSLGGVLSDGVNPAKGSGTLFEIPDDSRSILTLTSFDGANGNSPFGGLVTDSKGDLFGETQSSGGTGSDGTIFELRKSASSIATLLRLNDSTGTQPGTALAIDANGDLIGATSLSIFKLSAGGGATGTGTLGGALSGTLPTTGTAGEKVNISQKLTITDTGTGPVNGRVGIKLFLATGTTVDSDSIPVGSSGRMVTLAPNGHLTLPFKTVSLPVSVANATYHLIAQITDPSGNVSDAASSGTITVTPPQIDLTGAFSKTPIPGKNGKTMLMFTVTNLGATPADGLLRFDIESSPDGLLPDATLVSAPSKNVSIKPGKSTKISQAATLPAGSYFPLVQLDPADAFRDINLANNVFATAGLITVA